MNKEKTADNPKGLADQEKSKVDQQKGLTKGDAAKDGAEGFDMMVMVQKLMDCGFTKEEAEKMAEKDKENYAKIKLEEAALYIQTTWRSKKVAAAKKRQEVMRAWEESKKRFEMQQKEKTEREAQNRKNFHGMMEAFVAVNNAYHEEYVENKQKIKSLLAERALTPEDLRERLKASKVDTYYLDAIQEEQGNREAIMDYLQEHPDYVFGEDSDKASNKSDEMALAVDDQKTPVVEGEETKVPEEKTEEDAKALDQVGKNFTLQFPPTQHPEPDQVSRRTRGQKKAKEQALHHALLRGNGDSVELQVLDPATTTCQHLLDQAQNHGFKYQDMKLIRKETGAVLDPEMLIEEALQEGDTVVVSIGGLAGGARGDKFNPKKLKGKKKWIKNKDGINSKKLSDNQLKMMIACAIGLGGVENELELSVDNDDLQRVKDIHQWVLAQMFGDNVRELSKEEIADGLEAAALETVTDVAAEAAAAAAAEATEESKDNNEESKEETKDCVLCPGLYEGYGHNPRPLANEGRCCDDCNKTQVIPARFEARGLVPL